MESDSKSSKNPETEHTVIAIPSSTDGQVPLMGSGNSQNVSYPSPEVSNSSPSTSKPPKHPSSESSLTRRNSTFKQQNTRFGPGVVIDSKILESVARKVEEQKAEGGVPKDKKEKEKDKKLSPDEHEIYQRVTEQLSTRNMKRRIKKCVIELLVFFLLLALLICSLIVDSLKGKQFNGVELWKWSVLLMVIFSGMLITHWIVRFFVFLIEWKFLFRKNVVYFTYALKNSVKVFIWMGVVLGTWVLLFRPDIKKTPKAKKIGNFITWTLVSLFIGSFLWLLKTTLIKILASSFQFSRFFERIHEAVFHHYVLQRLSGRPLARQLSKDKTHVGQLSMTENTGTRKQQKKVVDWAKLDKMKKEKVPSWTMYLLADVITNSGLTTMSGMFEKDYVEGKVELDDDVITSEEEAIATAVKIFDNILGKKDTDSFITGAELHKFLIWEEVDLVYPLLEVDKDGKISLKAFTEWVVKVYRDREALQHALNDNKTAVRQFNQILTGILTVIIIVLWLLLTEIATTKILVFLSSQLLVAAFVFGNTCKTIFEAIVFVFLTHPFDVGDRCVIDGTMMVVEEMNILTTVFLKADKEKVYYPNALLATKSIGNYYRSPEQGDSLEFAIDYATSLDTIKELKEQIKKYLDENKEYWQPEYILVVKEIENLSHIKMALYVTHTINFQEYGEKLQRRSELVLQMKTIFDNLHISYSLLPQEIHLRNMTNI